MPALSKKLVWVEESGHEPIVHDAAKFKAAWRRWFANQIGAAAPGSSPAAGPETLASS